MKIFTTFRTKLMVWYAASLLTITAFFYIGLHVFRLAYGDVIYFSLVFFLALAGLYIIRKLTSGLSDYSIQIKSISSKNLNERLLVTNPHDEIGQIAISFNQLLSRLEEAFKREHHFLGDVAHELKTPLSALRATLELTLSKKRSNSEYKRAIQEALVDSHRLASTIKNILDLAWSQTEAAQEGAKVVNLSELVQELQEVAIKLAFEKQLTVNATIDNGLFVLGSKEKLFRAFLNIIDNAIKFSPNNSSVDIHLYSKNDQVVFTVKDVGPGIPEKELPHVFERFYRGAKTDKTIGSGLGLAIVNAVIKAHSGFLDITSKVDAGTIVKASLPILNNS